MKRIVMSDIYKVFEDLGIAYEEVQHEPLMSVADSKHLRGEIDGWHVRNMFLRDKKKRYWLLVAEGRPKSRFEGSETAFARVREPIICLT